VNETHDRETNEYFSGSGITEYELREEAESPLLKKTFRRIAKTIINPKRAMAYVSYDPDFLIIPLIIGILVIYMFLTPMVFMSKMDLPDDVVLKIPVSGDENQTNIMTVGELKSAFTKSYLTYNLAIFIFTLALSFISLYLASGLLTLLKKREEMEDRRLGDYKILLSGLFYSEIVSIVFGAVFFALVLGVQPVQIPVENANNITYIRMPNGTMVEANIESISDYFELKSSFLGYNANLMTSLRILSKLWQAAILIFLVKYSRNLSYTKSLLAVAIQQCVMWLLFGV
jgi:hypothetical protein